jgi:CBS domain-containing protein
MMQHNIGHCVTSDGAPNTEIIGIISEHDVLPLRLITLECVKQTKRANTAVELIRENLTQLIQNALYENISYLLLICRGDQYITKSH